MDRLRAYVKDLLKHNYYIKDKSVLNDLTKEILDKWTSEMDAARFAAKIHEFCGTKVLSK